MYVSLAATQFNMHDGAGIANAARHLQRHENLLISETRDSIISLRLSRGLERDVGHIGQPRKHRALAITAKHSNAALAWLKRYISCLAQNRHQWPP